MTMTTNKRPSILHAGPLHTRRSVVASLSMLPLVSLARCKSDDDAGGAEAQGEATRTAAGLEARYGAKIAQFVEAFNDHDLDRALSFFADNATLIVNEEPVEGHDAIRDFLIEYGASDAGGALAGAHMLHEVSYFTGDAILFDGMFHGTHERELSGYPATGFEFPIAFAFLCHFDEADRCISCDAILNWGALLPTPV
jgi:hypothetical protein